MHEDQLECYWKAKACGVCNQSKFGVSDALCASGRLRLKNMREFPGFTGKIICTVDIYYQYTGTVDSGALTHRAQKRELEGLTLRWNTTSIRLSSTDYTMIFYTTPA